MMKKFDFRKKFLEKLINFYGPFLGAGVKLQKMSDDYRHALVSMKLTFYNKNYVGVQFGGSLYAMVDPWYMLMLMKNLGNDYIVWDKSAVIHFRRPGKGKVSAEFRLHKEQIEEIKTKLEVNQKLDYAFHVDIKDEDGKLIADVDKVIYIRKKS
jgi:acyl-coenzyme A thioesterase PaaI-like protein